MIIKLQTPKKALNKAFLKQRPLRSEIDLFKSNLMRLLGCIDEIEREENQKNHIRDFLRDTYYKGVNEINTKDSKDLVIHIGKTNKDNVGVIVEAKRPSNTSEMISEKKPNAKALHEIILYYFDERNNQSNNELKNLIITNVYDWYIFDANVFDKYIYRNTKIKKLYDTYVNDKKDTPFFYEEVSKIIADLNIEIPCVNFDIRSYQKHLKDSAQEDDKQLIALYKILSPYHLLKVKFADDSNKLDELFYKELLHIIGLEEVKEGSKNIIRRKLENRNEASLLENAIDELKTEGLHKIPDIKSFGETHDEQIFNVALELCITWINRILFLKLLEGQLINYHGGDKSYRFLYKEMIFDYDELYKLFHKVLAVNIPERTTKIQEKYSHVPYLNSSLFEISELEDQTIRINSLDDSLELEILSNSVLKEQKKKTDKLLTIDYFFQFLDAYDFASEGSEEIQENSKSLINASVLGKVFEKLNGYKDGSIYTPGFITMYMCRQSIRLAVVQKFKDTYGWNIDQFEDIRNYLADRRSSKDILEFNQLINSVRLVDPAVGSGHFLVSALNELIAIKHDLGVFADETGSRLSSFEFEIANDELIVTDAEGDIFEYKYINGKPTSKDSQRLQKTLFHEKQNIIENCLFGVDLNPNSVKICRLRLWIELLKNAYYRESGELETLPNIDINIKCGNSLISRFPLDADLKKALKSVKYDINAYRGFVQDYKNEKNRETKKELQKLILSIKNDFKTEIQKSDEKFITYRKLRGQIDYIKSQTQLFEEENKVTKKRNTELKDLESKFKKIDDEFEEIKSNAIYKNAFEWRFEFPEILDDNGDFNGFDIVIGNPPYIQLQSMGQDTDALARVNYKTFARTGDIYSLFYEKGNEILKQQGYLSFITSNKWMRADYGLKTRQYIAEQTNPLYLIDFGMVLVFDNATVLSNILTFQKTNNLQQLKAIRTPDSFDLHTPLDEYFTSKSTDVKVDENAWVIQEGAVQLIKAKVEKQGIPLNKWDMDFLTFAA